MQQINLFRRSRRGRCFMSLGARVCYRRSELAGQGPPSAIGRYRCNRRSHDLAGRRPPRGQPTDFR